MAKCEVKGSLDDPSGGTMWVRFTCAKKAEGKCPLDAVGAFPDDIPQDVRHLSPELATAIGNSIMRPQLRTIRDACHIVPRNLKITRS